MINYKLRIAKHKDIEFLFEVLIKAMLPIEKISNPDIEPNLKEEFKEFSKNFVPEKIRVIEFDKIDVGRLRVVRSSEDIYVGGIQLLPEHQGKGIGSAIFKELLKESESLNIPIKLDVSRDNKKAIGFYTKFGFKKVGENETDWIMKYEPNKIALHKEITEQ